MSFFLLFTVNDSKKPPLEVMNALMDMDQSIFDRTTKKVYTVKGDKIYDTLFKVKHLGSFQARGSTRNQSKNDAMMLIFNRLDDLNNLVQEIESCKFATCFLIYLFTLLFFLHSQ